MSKIQKDYKLFHEPGRQPWPTLRVKNISHPRPVKVLSKHENKNVCKFYEKTMAKLAHALRSCEELVEEDFVFKKNKSKHNF